MIYHKLVRDNILNILDEQGKKYTYHKVFTDKEYMNSLKDKLIEEVSEFIEDPCIEEVADIMEVIRTICKIQDIDLISLEEVIENKNKLKGSFNKGIILETVDEE